MEDLRGTSGCEIEEACQEAFRSARPSYTTMRTDCAEVDDQHFSSEVLTLHQARTALHWHFFPEYLIAQFCTLAANLR